MRRGGFRNRGDNQVEIWFSIISRQAVRRDVHMLMFDGVYIDGKKAPVSYRPRRCPTQTCSRSCRRVGAASSACAPVLDVSWTTLKLSLNQMFSFAERGWRVLVRLLARHETVLP